MNAARINIGNEIIDLLQRGSIPISELITQIDALRHGVTRQGVYRALRKLKREEKIVIHGKSVSLNILWLRKMSGFFSVAQHYYSPKQSNPDFFLNLHEKEKAIFTFKTLTDLDSFSSHAIHMLAEIMGEQEPVYALNPHEIFSYGRQESERMLLEAIEGMKKRVFILSMHNFPLDTALKQRFSGTNVEYHIVERTPFKKRNYYFNVYGDYLLEFTLDKKLDKEIESFYVKFTVFNAEAEKYLSEIFLTKGRNKLAISKNKKKAVQYKKFFSKYF